jgi:recombination associated protein RdgC
VAKDKHNTDIPSALEILDREDFMELWNEKLFLGQEFLTWLWLVTEENSRTMTLPGGREIEVWFENQLQLTLGNGQNKRSVSIVTPEEPSELDWNEAYAAVKQHKKVTKGTLRIKTDVTDWRLTLPHDTLTPQGVKVTTVKDPGEDNEDLGKIGIYLDKLASTAELISILEAMFTSFINLRLSPEWETVELQRLQDFLSSHK